MTKADVEDFLREAMEAHFQDRSVRACSDVQQLSPYATVHIWLANEGECNALPAETLVHYACANHGYFTFEAEFSAFSSLGYVRVDEPTTGLLRVPPPRSTEEFGFNWNRSRIQTVTKGRKDDCRVDWRHQTDEEASTSLDILT